MPLPYLLDNQRLNANATRKYPLDDAASCLDAGGQGLPQDILTDLNLWFAGTGVERAFISSLGISPNLVSLTIGQSAGSSFMPLAALTLPRPVAVYRNYRLDAMIPGVDGWVAFGPGANTRPPANYRFLDPTAALILPRLSRSYPVQGVTSVGVANRLNPFTGLVQILSGDPDLLQITRQRRFINGQTVEALVFALNVAVQGPQIFRRFLGPCDATPLSGNCSRPPILAINDALPDANGTLFINIVEQANPQFGTVFTIATASPDTTIASLLGMSNICPTATEKFPVDIYTNCDDPCDPTLTGGT